jgi:hypothetical protein
MQYNACRTLNAFRELLELLDAFIVTLKLKKLNMEQDIVSMLLASKQNKEKLRILGV